MSVYMCGRAGRRGLDDRGVCVSSICVHVYTCVLEVCVDECVYERACWAAWPG